MEDVNNIDCSLVSTVKDMGFIPEDKLGTYVRRECDDHAFVMEIDEAEDSCIDGIRYYECYGNPTHRREIAFDRYVGDDVESIEGFIEYCGCRAWMDARDQNMLVKSLSVQLHETEKERDCLQSVYDELSGRVSADILSAHLDACRKAKA